MSETTTNPACPQGHPVQLLGGFCRTCATCRICGKSMSVIEYEFCLRQAAKASTEETTVQPTFEHPACFSEIDRLTIAAETAPVPKHVLDKLNAARLLIEPQLDRNIRTNEQDADIRGQQWIHESAQGRNHEEHQKYLVFVLRRLESLCATFSLAVSKQRRTIEESLNREEIEAFEVARQARAVHAIKAPKTVAKKQTKEEKELANAVATLMRFTGITETAALAQIQESKAKRAANG